MYRYLITHELDNKLSSIYVYVYYPTNTTV